MHCPNDGGAVIIPSIEHTFGDLYGIRITEDGLFHGVATAHQERRSRIARRTFAEAGEHILIEGSVPDEIVVLVDGRAELVLDSDSTSPLRTPAAEREIFGLPEALGRSGLVYGVEAVSACSIDRIPLCEFEGLLKSEPISLARLIRILGLAVQMRHHLAHLT